MTNQALRDLAERYWAFQCEESPLDAWQAGVKTDAEVMLREAPEDYERRAAWAQKALAELDALETTHLEPDDRATHALLRRELQLQIETVRVRAHLRPIIYPLGPEFGLGYWAGAVALATPEDARRYITRLARIHEAIDSVRRSLARGYAEGLRYPRLVLERGAAQVRGQIAAAVEQSPFYAPLARAAARSSTMTDLAAEGRRIVAESIYPAYES